MTELAPLIFQMESLSSAVIRGEEDAIKRASELVSQVTEENIGLFLA